MEGNECGHEDQLDRNQSILRKGRTRRKPLVPISFGGKAELLAFPTSAVPPACLPPHEDKEVDKSPQGLS